MKEIIFKVKRTQHQEIQFKHFFERFPKFLFGSIETLNVRDDNTSEDDVKINKQTT